MTQVEIYNGSNWVSLATLDTAVMYGYVSTGYTTNIAVNDHIKFNSIQFQKGIGITLDATSSYTNVSGQPSIGRITLSPNRTYKVIGSIPNADATICGIQWYDVTTSTSQKISLASVVTTSYSVNSQVSGNFALAYITPSANMIIELRLIYNSLTNIRGTENPIPSTPWFTIETIF